MEIIEAFIVGGVICSLGQLIMDKFKLLPIHITCLFVFLGSILEVYNIYDKLIAIGHFGAKLPISSFGHSITEGALEGIKQNGIIGLLDGAFRNVSIGISAAILFAFLAAIIFKPKG